MEQKSCLRLLAELRGAALELCAKKTNAALRQRGAIQMKIAIGCDHGAYALKEKVIAHLKG